MAQKSARRRDERFDSALGSSRPRDRMARPNGFSFKQSNAVSLKRYKHLQRSSPLLLAMNIGLDCEIGRCVGDSGIDGQQWRRRFRRRWDLWSRVREPARLPEIDECAEAAAAVEGSREVRGITPRPRGDRDRVCAEAAGNCRRPGVLLSRGVESVRSTIRQTRFFSR